MKNVLLIGSGGREHTLAWKIAQSPRLARLYIAPGNAGTAGYGENIQLDINDHAAVTCFCNEKQIDFVLVGPEAPLAAGLVDTLSVEGIRCFGPTQAAAQIEASKVFAKRFMSQHNIPTAAYATFNQFDEAMAYLERIDYPIVIKASGLAAGKGVILPETIGEAKTALESILVKKAFGQAGNQVVIEERLHGEEVSLMAFTDGKSIVPMLPAQDHKRLQDGDIGPNTGGMGAYAPAPIFTADLMEEALECVLSPTIRGLHEAGTPFVGVLYGGLILTPRGLRVLEFNCRFGDPETQAVLPLLETDLLEITEACVDGNLKDVDIRWKDGAAVCVVLAGRGYPENVESGRLVTIDALPDDTACFHAGTKMDVDQNIITSGGRVLGLTAWADTIESATRKAYANIGKVWFEGMQYRKDIAGKALNGYQRINGWHPLESADAIRLSVSRQPSAYSSSGVDIDAGNRAVDLMKDAVKSTYTPSVLAGIGAFGGLYDASILKMMKSPVLVASTDGVGTKVKLAASVGGYRGIGHDIVNHCINDILVQGARPLFFMDYFAASKLNPEQVAEVVTGIAEACNEAEIALLGGETAEMPGVYQPNEFDVAGTIVGVLERDELLPRPDLKVGDVLIGLLSSGPHTNGYSLIRKVFANTPLDTVFPELGCSLVEALLAPHRSYLSTLQPLLPHLKALAHLTGGGFIENIPRILPESVNAEIRVGSWPVPPLFKLIQSQGEIELEEMYRVFNMGIGMIAIVDKSSVTKVRELLSEETFVIGELVKGKKQVQLLH